MRFPYVLFKLNYFVWKVRPANLVSINEEEELKAQKQYYASIEAKMKTERRKRLNLMQRVSLVYNPLMAVVFVVVYWVMGLRHADII